MCKKVGEKISSPHGCAKHAGHRQTDSQEAGKAPFLAGAQWGGKGREEVFKAGGAAVDAVELGGAFRADGAAAGNANGNGGPTQVMAAMRHGQQLTAPLKTHHYKYNETGV